MKIKFMVGQFPAREFLRRDLPIIFMDRLLKRPEAEGRK